SALIFLGIAFSVVSLVLTATNYGRLAESIVIKFDTLQEVSVFGEKSGLWGIWLLGLTMMGMNGVLMYEFWNRERFLSYIFAFANSFLSLLVFLIIVVLLSNN
ncbi:hypothetical protein C4565_01705, partial [Candidatus Parcubacteria bacterium]